MPYTGRQKLIQLHNWHAKNQKLSLLQLFMPIAFFLQYDGNFLQEGVLFQQDVLATLVKGTLFKVALKKWLILLLNWLNMYRKKILFILFPCWCANQKYPVFLLPWPKDEVFLSLSNAQKKKLWEKPVSVHGFVHKSTV